MTRAGGAYATQGPAGGIGRRVGTAILFIVFLVGTSVAQSDTTIYDRIDRIAEKHRFFRWLHEGIFVKPTKEAPVGDGVQPRRVRDPNERFRGRWIRHVDIRVLDPFGNDLDDTSAFAENGLQRLGNRWHARTRPFLIRRLLLIEEGTRVDPLRISESERVLRTSPMVNDARVHLVPLKHTRDSVDVIVLIQDRWTLGAELTGDLTSAYARIAEYNVLGYGQAIDQRVSYSLGAQRPSWAGDHRIHNIDDTFISTRLGYVLTPDADGISLSLDRPFYSALARWAGNVSLGHTWSHPAPDTTDGTDQLTLQANRYDLDTWVGTSLRTGTAEVPSVQAASIILAARYATSWYNTRPATPLSDSIFMETRLGLTSISVSVRQYTTDRYLYRFGLKEDVAEGFLLTGSSGGRWGPHRVFEPYLGISCTRARYFSAIGYLSLRAGVGTFLPDGKVQDGLVLLEARYFTPAFTAGRWHIRQFARLAFAKALSPIALGGIDLNGQQLLGFEPEEWRGEWKAVLKLETVVYLPYEFIGFRFAPVLLAAVGTLGSEHEPLFQRALQPAFGIGLLIRNEHLLIKTFQVSIGFYPHVLPNGPDLFRWDALESFQLRNPDLAPSRPDLLGGP